MAYTKTARFLHWTVAVLVLLMLAAGLVMTGNVGRALQDSLFIFHKNTGALLIFIIALRLAWRATHAAPPLPHSVPPLQRRVARATHALLYLLLIVMVASGFVRVTMGGFPIELMDWLGVPRFMPKDERVAEVAKAIHATTKNALIVLIALHVAAAAYHGIIRRDGVFSRMWPPV
jgi:cytochrome b561